MCGIAYEHNLSGLSVNRSVLKTFQAQRARGTEGFGFFDGQHLVHAAQEKRIVRQMKRNHSSLMLFHHRYPTTTINVKQAAHPFTTKGYFGETEYILVQNGGVTNADELRKAHTELEIQYHSVLQDKSFNDSEAFLWDFALYMEGKQKELKAKGPCAFVCLKLVRGKVINMYFGRNWERPLSIFRDKETIRLSSEGETEHVMVDKLFTWNYARRRLYERKMDVPYVQHVYTGAYARKYQAPLPYKDSGVRNSGWANNDYQPPAGDDWREQYPNLWAQMHYDEEHEMWEEGESVPLLPASLPAGEVETEAMQYLSRSKGNFDQAYYLAENDYMEEMDLTDASTHRIRLLERVLEYIQSDSEYVNEKSVSSIWEEAWVK